MRKPSQKLMAAYFSWLKANGLHPKLNMLHLWQPMAHCNGLRMMQLYVDTNIIVAHVTRDDDIWLAQIDILDRRSRRVLLSDQDTDEHPSAFMAQHACMDHMLENWPREYQELLEETNTFPFGRAGGKPYIPYWGWLGIWDTP